MKIYSFPFCPFCYRVKLALKIKGIPMSEIQIEEIDMNSPPSEFKKINPNLSVPTLELSDGSGFAESMVIVEYLDSSFESKIEKLYGNNAEEMAKIKYLVERISKEVIPFLMNCIFSNGNQVKLKKALQEVPQAFKKLDMILEHANSPYFGGNDFNAIDISIAPFLCYYLFAQKINLKYPLPDVNSKSDKYIKNLLDHRLVNEVILSNTSFKEQLNKSMSEPENIKFIKNSSRNLIENISSDLVNLNKKIASNTNSNSPTFWKLNNNDKGPYIETIFQFKNYEEALDAIQKICELQESSDHHANFSLENFDQLKVEVCTHQPKWGVTAMDLAFAETLSLIILN
jgi:glutathione S-transferase/pterin-4a-carbinolamine dehydratase